MMLTEASEETSLSHRCVSPEVSGKFRTSQSPLSAKNNPPGLVNLISMSLVMGNEDSNHQLFQRSAASTHAESSPLDLLDALLFTNDDLADLVGSSEEKKLPVESTSSQASRTVSFEESIMNEDLEPVPFAPAGFSEMPTTSSSSSTHLACHPVTPNLSATSAAEGALERLLAQEFQLEESVAVVEPIAATSSGAKRAQEEVEESSPTPKKKKRCISSLRITTCEGGPKFRDYQEQQWNDKFDELLKFKSSHGHCLVPHTFEGNPALSRWVKRQRYQYKLFQKNNGESTMTKNRVDMLENIGFVWDSHAVAWGERLQELKKFQSEYGHCNVPSHYQKIPPLAVWVKRQRRQVKLFWKGERSTITQERFEALRGLGFTWELRRSKNSLS